MCIRDSPGGDQPGLPRHARWAQHSRRDHVRVGADMPVSRPYAVASVTGAQSRRAAPPDPKDLTPQECARRERIIQAGLSLLIKRPYEQVKVRDVADGAGVALGTVYPVSYTHL